MLAILIIDLGAVGPAGGSLSIFGIPDRSQKVGWKFILAVAILAPSTYLISHRWPEAWRSLTWIVLAIGAVGFLILLYYLWFSLFAPPHPANRIAELLKTGHVTEACALGAALLEKIPNDTLVQLNSVAAFHAAGKLDEARGVLATVKTDGLQKVFAEVYAHWQGKLNPSPLP